MLWITLVYTGSLSHSITITIVCVFIFIICLMSDCTSLHVSELKSNFIIGELIKVIHIPVTWILHFISTTPKCFNCFFFAWNELTIACSGYDVPESFNIFENILHIRLLICLHINNHSLRNIFARCWDMS